MSSKNTLVTVVAAVRQLARIQAVAGFPKQISPVFREAYGVHPTWRRFQLQKEQRVFDSAGKPDALHTLREFGYKQFVAAPV